MSIFDREGVTIFPWETIKRFVTQYTESHGEAPKVIAISKDDMVTWILSSWGGSRPAEILGMKLVTADYLQSGEIDLAADIVEEEEDEQ